MISVWYISIFAFFYIINAQGDFYTLRPDTIYLAYFYVGVVIILSFFNGKLVANKNLVNFNEELVYFTKMSMFFYLSILDAFKRSYITLHKFVFFYNQIFKTIFSKYIIANSSAVLLSLKNKYYLLYTYSLRCIAFENLIRRFIQHIYIKSIIKVTRGIIFKNLFLK
jgi:hypothetical protein